MIMKYRLRFFHTDPSVVSVVGDYDTLEAAKMGAGIGYGIIEWRELAPNSWIGESDKLPFWYTINSPGIDAAQDATEATKWMLDSLDKSLERFGKITGE